MSDEGTDLPLPFDASLLLPFILAWRATPSALAYDARCQAASRQLASWGYSLDKMGVAGAQQALSLVCPMLSIGACRFTRRTL